ncbi:MAG TPA: maleylpyruvate isomerase family mycothiol-dependent enzyme, partial [Micromonosporaceae bacterium]
MTFLIDRIIAALGEEQADLTALVPALTDDQLAGPSGASQWAVAEVLGHMGSGAEITLAGLHAALEGRAAPDAEFNGPVWDRWNAMSADEKRAGYLEKSAALISAFEALDRQQRDSLEIDVSYMPAPMPVATFAGLQLNERALHGWDVRVGVDPDAELHTSSAEL